jgi:hypothetical protein
VYKVAGPELLPKPPFDPQDPAAVAEFKKVAQTAALALASRVSPAVARPLLRAVGIEEGLGLGGVPGPVTTGLKLLPQPFGAGEPRLFGLSPDYYLPKGAPPLPGFVPGAAERRTADAAAIDQGIADLRAKPVAKQQPPNLGPSTTQSPKPMRTPAEIAGYSVEDALRAQLALDLAKKSTADLQKMFNDNEIIQSKLGTLPGSIQLAQDSIAGVLIDRGAALRPPGTSSALQMALDDRLGIVRPAVAPAPHPVTRHLFTETPASEIFPVPSSQQGPSIGPALPTPNTGPSAQQPRTGTPTVGPILPGQVPPAAAAGPIKRPAAPGTPGGPLVPPNTRTPGATPGQPGYPRNSPDPSGPFIDPLIAHRHGDP